MFFYSSPKLDIGHRILQKYRSICFKILDFIVLFYFIFNLSILQLLLLFILVTSTLTWYFNIQRFKYIYADFIYILRFSNNKPNIDIEYDIEICFKLSFKSYVIVEFTEIPVFIDLVPVVLAPNVTISEFRIHTSECTRKV